MPTVIDVRGASARLAQALAAIGGGVSGIINPNQEVQRQVRTLISTDHNAAAALGHAVRQNPDAFRHLGSLADELARMPETPEMVVRGAATTGLAALTSPDVDPAEAIKNLTPIQMNAVAGLFGMSPQQLIAQPGQVRALAEASPELYEIGAVRDITGARPTQLKGEEIDVERGGIALKGERAQLPVVEAESNFRQRALLSANSFFGGLDEAQANRMLARYVAPGAFEEDRMQQQFLYEMQLVGARNASSLMTALSNQENQLAEFMARKTQIANATVWRQYLSNRDAFEEQYGEELAATFDGARANVRAEDVWPEIHGSTNSIFRLYDDNWRDALRQYNDEQINANELDATGRTVASGINSQLGFLRNYIELPEGIRAEYISDPRGVLRPHLREIRFVDGEGNVIPETDFLNRITLPTMRRQEPVDVRPTTEQGTDAVARQISDLEGLPPERRIAALSFIRSQSPEMYDSVIAARPEWAR